MKKIQALLQAAKEKYKAYSKNRSNTRRFKSFYASRKEDKRSDFAKVVDYILMRIFIFFSVLALVYVNTRALFVSTLTSVIILTIYHVISIRIRNQKLTSNKREKRKTIAYQRVYKEMLNKTVEEMREYITEVFTRCDFTNIKHIENHHKSILFEASYKGSNVLIACYIYKNDFDVELKEIKEFICEAIQHETKKGIILTTSDFTQDCYIFTEGLSESYTLVLLNKEKLLNTIETCEMLPSEEEIDEAIENQISKTKKNWRKYKAVALSNKKIKGYILLMIYLTIASFFTAYRIYYIVFVGIVMFLALTTFIFNYFNKIAIEEKQESAENIFSGL